MINLYRLTAFLEGVSYILLLFIAVPIKYLLNEALYVKILGMPHGILFILYVLLSIIAKIKYNWNFRKFLFISTASLVPFGTFYIDIKYLKKLYSN
jgi:integral membrane protein